MKQLTMLASAATALAFGLAAASASAQTVPASTPTSAPAQDSGFGLGFQNQSAPAPTTSTTPPPSSTGGFSTTFGFEIIGGTFGEGFTAAKAEGEEKETEAFVVKEGFLDLAGSVSGGACETDCTALRIDSAAGERIYSFGSARAAGPGSASAHVGNELIGGVAVQGQTFFERRPIAPTTTPGH